MVGYEPSLSNKKATQESLDLINLNAFFGLGLCS